MFYMIVIVTPNQNLVNLNSNLKYSTTPTLIITCYLREPSKWCSDSLGTLLTRTPWRGDTEVSDLNTNITAQSTVKQQDHTAMNTLC